MKKYSDFKQIKASYKKEVIAQQRQFKKDLKEKSIKEIKSWWIFDKLSKKQQALSAAEIRKILIIKRELEDEKRIKDFYLKCDEIALTAPCDSISISVSWAKNKTWGMNPSAEIMSGGQHTTGHASGCGYDKLSSAIGNALNKNYSILNRLYNAYEKQLRKNKNISIHEAIGYGAGYKTPYFEGGVGYSCFRSIFQELGAKVNIWQEGKAWDSMLIEF